MVPTGGKNPSPPKAPPPPFNYFNILISHQIIGRFSSTPSSKKLYLIRLPIVKGRSSQLAAAFAYPDNDWVLTV